MKYYGADYQNSRQAALKAALDYALANGGTVKLEKDVNVEFDATFINVATGQSLALDLNGCTINAVATASGTVKQVLVSKGTAVTNQQAIIIVG